MNKIMKIVYLDQRSGREVHYGEDITYQEEGFYNNRYHWKSETTLRICNETIPMLIEKGILVQKEIEERNEDKVHIPDTSIEERINILTTAVNSLIKKVRRMEEHLKSNDFIKDNGEE